MTSPTPGHDPGSTQTSPDDEADDGRRDPDGRSEPDPGRDGGGDAGGTDGPARPSAAELEDRWRRAVADLDNLRKRHARALGRERAEERGRVAGAFLPVLDNLDLALQHAQADPGAVLEGVRAVREQAAAILAGLGYPRQDDTGVPFDPSRHEVVGVVAPANGEEPGHVADVVRPGYGTPERQLRPASVTVTGPAEG
ncbi:nucleotide exchange factor GrpE [Actinomycetospora chiangmaiensis]|uniref:nucleotide exchange factor GrpE n=1 Tax=Actinomycetospora chiangmaiensis TaxID=402650 RepID=UPI000367D91A|nr:nucleotide exchange factor GrpE [Actinomycetospora chiangmaiensis]